MLVLTRKIGESILIDDDILVSVVKIDGSSVRLGVQAPKEIPIVRNELCDDSATPERRVLVVDDSPADRMMYRRFLEGRKSGRFVVSEAECGGEGLEMYEERRPDCILLDYRLPDLDGVEFLESLERIDDQLAVPVIMLTRFGDETLRQKAFERGASGYLFKDDLTDHVLLQQIGRVLRDASRTN